jgi:hypothetical protein
VTSTRRLALAGGVFYLLTFVFSIPAYFPGANPRTPAARDCKFVERGARTNRGS